MSESNWSQVKSGKWPSGEGRAIALLRASPEELGRRFHIDFSNGSDELGRLVEAGLLLASGKGMLLVQRESSLGTEVWVDADVQPANAIEDLIRSLPLEEQDIVWRADQEADESR
jgi:hypothetical protein